MLAFIICLIFSRIIIIAFLYHRNNVMSIRNKQQNAAQLAHIKYENYIRNSNGMPVVMYSCSLGECANDNSELDDDYSYQLIKVGKRFAMKAGEDVLDVVEAHYIAKAELEKLNHTQHLRIYRVRSGSYYPFAIKLNNVEG